jgi:tRNA-dihydrouridine synthase A
LRASAAAGVTTFIVHARKAWLSGLSPKENRDVPPLDYPLVWALKAANPDLTIVMNGGIASLDAALEHLVHLDGVMLGRAAYHDPATTLIGADALWGDGPGRDAHQVVAAMRPYIARHLAAGGRLHQITRHMLGLFHGKPGARLWRRVLSEGVARPGAGLELIDQGLAEVVAQVERQAALAGV